VTRGGEPGNSAFHRGSLNSWPTGLVRAAKWAGAGPGVVLALALLLRMPALNGGQIDYDEGVYWQSLRSMAAGHPLFSQVYSSQPPAFLLLIFPFYWVVGRSLVGARVAVLFVFLVGLVAAYRLVSQLSSRAAGTVAMAVLAADPVCFRGSVVLQADIPAMGFALIGLALAVEAGGRTRQAGGRAVAAGVALSTGFLVKPLAAAAGPAVMVALGSLPLLRRERFRRYILAAAGGLAAAAVILLPFLSVWRPLWEQTVGLHFVARSAQIGGLDAQSVLLEVPVLILGTAGLLLAVRHAPRFALVAGAWAAAAALMLAIQRPLWPHHLVALTVPLALLAGGLAELRFLGRKVSLLKGLAALLVLAGSLGSALYVRQRQLSDDSLRPAVARLQAATGPADLIVTDDQYLVALAGRDTPPQLVDASLVRINSGELTAAQVELIAERSGARAVLLGGGRLSELPAVEDWARTHYRVREQLDSRSVLYFSPVGS
jgi:4-amino-4-deoxy-L-arabinose transferase-like glycosyltransferase